MNKTEIELVSRLVNRFDKGSLKQGWLLEGETLQLQKLNEGQQAHNLAEKYPSIFESDQLMYRLVKLKLLDNLAARKLIEGKG